MNSNLYLLDCTLRDGGYINEWKWGYHTAKEIINLLVKANIDVVEVGFLKNVEDYNPDITTCNHIEELNRLLPSHKNDTIFSAMAMRSNYDISKLTPYSGHGIEMIRVTAHDYDIMEGMDFAKEIKTKGYKLSINPINIMGYSDKQILWIIDQVNKIHPYQFSVVDTFGSMKRRDLDRIVSLVDNNLDKNIRLALHLHENMALGCLLAQNFADMHLGRPVAIDGSLMGMGRIPGNLPIELIADYLNEYVDKSYDIDYMMDAIEEYIAPIKGMSKWGYTPAYFLSARFNLHRNYAEYYLQKGDLTNRDINHILAGFDRDKATTFDVDYAERRYREYQNHNIDDTATRKILTNIFCGKTILIIAPGPTIKTHKNAILNYIEHYHPITIAANFIPESYDIEYAFFCNNKRFNKLEKRNCKIIATSNLSGHNVDYYIDYNSLSSVFNLGGNSLMMLLNLFQDMNVGTVALAGADGFTADRSNYYRSDIRSRAKHDNGYNLTISKAIKNTRLHIEFVTPSFYDI